MASTLPSVEGCCTPCVEPVSVAVPGPQGAAGAAGTNGTNGVNAFTTITGGAAVMPAEGANVTLAVVSSAWMSATEVVYIESRGYMEVQSKPTTTSVILKNLENAAAGTYLANSPPGTVFTAALGVSPGGLQGPAGINGTSGAPTTSTYILKTPDGALASAQALSILATGYMKSAFATGAVTTQAVPIPIADGGTGAITAPAALTALAAAPSNATFITQIAEAGLSAEQSLASLPTGYVTVTTVTGVLGSTAVPIPIADGGTGGITAAAARTALGVQRAPQDILIYQHQLAAGTDAGSATLGSWETVPLNTEVADTGNHGSIAANTITLAAGVYRVHWRTCGYQVDSFQSRLFNVTNAGIIGLGSNAKAALADTTMQLSQGEARITITAATEDVRIQSQCQTSNAGDGFGVANAFGGTQVYAGIWIEKEVG